MNNISIKRYNPRDEACLFALIENEGEEWIGYWGDDGKPKYQKALANSIVYLLFENEFALSPFARDFSSVFKVDRLILIPACDFESIDI